MRLRSALVLLLWSSCSAGAADWYTGARPQAARDAWIVSADVSSDITTQNSYFADVVVTGATTGTLLESGPRLRIDALGGRYSYRSESDNRTIDGTQTSGAALIGYEWVSPSVAFAAYLGADIRNNTLSFTDPGNPVVGTSFGAKGQVEIYARPSVDTMIAVNAAYATNKTAYFARLRAGYRIGPDLYVGPEFVALGDAFFNQERIGAHVSGPRLGPLRMAFAAGFLYDRVRKSGGYVTLDARLGF